MSRSFSSELAQRFFRVREPLFRERLGGLARKPALRELAGECVEPIVERLAVGLHVLAEVPLDLAEPAKHLVAIDAAVRDVLDEAIVTRHRLALRRTLARERELFADVPEELDIVGRHEERRRRGRRRNHAHDPHLEERERDESRHEKRDERRLARHRDGHGPSRRERWNRRDRVVDRKLHERAPLALGNARKRERIRDPASGRVVPVERDRTPERRAPS